MTAPRHPWSALPPGPVWEQARLVPTGQAFLLRPSSDRPEVVAVGFMRGPCDEPVRCEPVDRAEALYTRIEVEEGVVGEIWCFERLPPVAQVIREIDRANAFGLGVEAGPSPHHGCLR